MGVSKKREGRRVYKSCIKGGEIPRVCCYVRRKTCLFTIVGLGIFQNSRPSICITYGAFSYMQGSCWVF